MLLQQRRGPPRLSEIKSQGYAMGHACRGNRRKRMRSFLALTATAAALAGSAFAQSNQDHDTHHPPGASAPAAAARKAPPPSSTQIDKQMKSMQDMHEKMMAAKTPEERRALMADHMKVMKDGMAMMGGMSAGGGKSGTSMPMDSDMMSMRMDMMQMMMQMMMDRDETQAPGK
jgi:hypothetical protein